MRFDPTTPTELQRQDWTCAIRSTMWLLKSLGIAVTPEEAQDAMSPRYVNSDVGLLDASGAGIVAVLAEHWGVQAINDAAATFDEVAALAGKQPVAIGLRNWGGAGKGHWSAVRSFDGELLWLANPAGTGPIYGHQALNRTQFGVRGPASMVTIPLVDAAPAETLRGIDVASYQGNPDWAAVAASGVAFAITKATQGVGYLNPTFTRNWTEIRRAGLVRGAYHYAEPAENSAEAEAAYFLSNVSRLGIEQGDLLALDLEPPASVPGVGRWALEFLDRVETATGVRPLLYTGPWVIERDGLGDVADLGHYPLWLAAYRENMPTAPAPWSEIAIWQHSDAGKVIGIGAAVDLNRFNGTRAELLALGKGGSVAEPEIDIDPRDKQISGLLVAVAELTDVVVEEENRAARLARAREIREQFVGPRPAA